MSPASSSPDAPRIRFGTSSFSSPDWVGPFYPPGTQPADFLRVYATHFDTVEIDATYYAIPSAKTVVGWAAKTPESFLFALKFPRAIVHAGEGARPDPNRLLSPEHAYPVRDRFLEVVGRLGLRAGPLLLQFPYLGKQAFPEPGPFLERLDRFLRDLPRDFRYAVEIRNARWIGPALADLCRAHHASMVLVDQAWMPHADEIDPRVNLVTADLVYVRLLGDRRRIEARTRRWSAEVLDRGDRLQRWATFLAEIAGRHVPAVVYVNNHYAGHAPATTRRLQALFARTGAPAS